MQVRPDKQMVICQNEVSITGSEESLPAVMSAFLSDMDLGWVTI